MSEAMLFIGPSTAPGAAGSSWTAAGSSGPIAAAIAQQLRVCGRPTAVGPNRVFSIRRVVRSLLIGHD